MTSSDFNTLSLDALFEQLIAGPHLDQLLQIAVEEDLGTHGDVTTAVHEGRSQSSSWVIRAREQGVLSGVPVLDLLLRRYAPKLSWWWEADDGERLEPGAVVCRISGSLGQMLPIERTLLNMLGRLSGVASLTGQFVAEVAGIHVQICDTRKTTPGYRTLEKYAVRCGGGHLHRIGLYDAFLLKDNHVADYLSGDYAGHVTKMVAAASVSKHELQFIEVEVDSIDLLKCILQDQGNRERIDIILIDNMSLKDMRDAVAWRDKNAPSILLEASGGITLEKVKSVAKTGVDRIAVGALTHSATQIDFGLDHE